MSKLRIGLLGYSGRMGQAIAGEIAQDDRCILTAGLVRQPSKSAAGPCLLSTNMDDVLAASDVIIDFTLAESTLAHAEHAAAIGKAFVAGATALSRDSLEGLQKLAQHAPVLYAPNTSLSLAATKSVVMLAARLLAEFDYDIAIYDEHHRMKKDAPSGTALALGEAVKAGNLGKREPSYAAIRAGSIVGNHDVIFAGEGEMIRIHHSVTDRRIFARGAITAACWLYGKPTGFYTMDDVLSIHAPKA